MLAMQGAPADQMGAIHPHMFFILLLLHGATAAPTTPLPKWQTLSGKPISFDLSYGLSLICQLQWLSFHSIKIQAFL
jgi:hypothetical protein